MDNFLDTIYEWVENTESNIDNALQTMVLLIGNSVVTLSPVDTGRFKGNWQLTIGEMAGNSLVRYDPQGTAVLNEMARTVTQFTAGQIAYIQNHVLYGNDLEHGLYNGPTQKVTEEGYSRQAPEGMVQITASKFQKIVADAVRLSKEV
ncbi:hypothetical protein PMW_133 [Pseudomonas phage phiPMW]|uniref:Neck protein n=1 Tax=Pseudomonas phage phiPMW TaxID=1815582 RepID=A0A1S5R1L0_9CAUD|nr:tail completion or Neck1 protein [Pseudomonas phage phiPMW]ANA49258.1 hypothetical protein PMW_133 [Pseudomonas phage phiPMW]